MSADTDKDPNPLLGLPTEGREVDLEAHFIGSSDDGWDHQPTAAYTRRVRTEKILAPVWKKHERSEPILAGSHQGLEEEMRMREYNCLAPCPIRGGGNALPPAGSFRRSLASVKSMARHGAAWSIPKKGRIQVPALAGDTAVPKHSQSATGLAPFAEAPLETVGPTVT